MFLVLIFFTVFASLAFIRDILFYFYLFIFRSFELFFPITLNSAKLRGWNVLKSITENGCGCHENQRNLEMCEKSMKHKVHWSFQKFSLSSLS